MFFPNVSGSNLAGRAFYLPFDLDGEYNLVMLAFEPGHQLLMASWLPTFELLTKLYNNVNHYELPTLWDYNEAQRALIDNGMRRMILDPAMRERVVTLYVDKAHFAELLELPDEDTIYVFLIDHEGEIHFRAEGSATQESRAALVDKMRELQEIADAFSW